MNKIFLNSTWIEGMNLLADLPTDTASFIVKDSSFNVKSSHLKTP